MTPPTNNLYLWTTLAILTLVGLRQLISRPQKSRALNLKTENLIGEIKRHEPAINHIHSELQVLLRQPRYLAFRDFQRWSEELEDGMIDSLNQALALLSDSSVADDPRIVEQRQCAQTCADAISGDSMRIKRRNASLVEKELIKHREFFDSVEKLPLTDEQRVASIEMEDRNLLVAAAGSGKTSAIIGKIGYILKTQMAQPDEILVLAFNKNAAGELEERITGRLGAYLKNGKSVKAKTFHGLGLEIIAEAEGVKPSVSEDSLWVEQIIQRLLREDEEFASDWATFLSLCPRAASNPHQFRTLDEWNEYVGATSGGEHYVTFQGERVKSQGELAIANWLFKMGLPYAYEKPYEFRTADKDYGQYKPDFTLPSLNCYLEHLALDSHGKPPQQFAKYSESLEWKRALHAEKGTTLLETTFAEFIKGSLFIKMEQELAALGAKFSPRQSGDILKRINSAQKKQTGSLVQTFIKHAKSNEIADADLTTRAGNRYRERLFTQLASKVRTAYEEMLRKNAEIDFEDMIVQATQHIAAGRYQHNFRFILIDEFQDVSQARGGLVKSLLNEAPDCKLFCVGDDWQSIYRFAGADIGLFTDFSTHYGHTATNYLTKTFRSNQGIVDVAAGFVQKNKRQLAKAVAATDTTRHEVVEIKFYRDASEVERLIDGILGAIDTANDGAAARPTVYILGRYNRQKPVNMGALCKRYGARLKIEFMTIHKSKGLESDYVILLGLESGKKAGFPSEMADDPLLQLVMPRAESHQHAEERRLFYVALTRAKRKVFILGSLTSPSSFLTEIMRDNQEGSVVKAVK